MAFAPRGRIVKTIGDSVMAAFPTGTAALQAAASGLERVQEACRHPGTGEPLQIRMGIHRGPALVVPVNGINDYFGQTVNLAARIESVAGPSQCLVSAEVLDDPDARTFFDELVGGSAFTASGAQQIQPRGIAGTVTVHGLSLAF